MFLVTQAKDYAMPTAPLHRRAKALKLERVQRGVYVDTGSKKLSDLSREARHVVSILATAHGDRVGVVSGISAAILHGLPILNKRMTHEVHVARSHSGKKSKWVITHRGKLAADDIVIVAGVRCTSLERTFRDLGFVFEPHELLAIADEIAARGVRIDPARFPRTHSAMLTWIVAHADGRAESFAESWSRYQLLAAGYPAPLLQPELYDEHGGWLARPDFFVPSGIVGEFDGKIKYGELLDDDESPTDVVMAEKTREDGMRERGLEVVRWDWKTLEEPGKFIRRWRIASDRAAQSAAPRVKWVMRTRPLRVGPDWSETFSWREM